MSDQFILSATLVALLGFFIWGKFRYDAISIGALIVLVIFGGLIVLTQGSAVAPFIYTIF